MNMYAQNQKTNKYRIRIMLIAVIMMVTHCSSFTLEMMGARRGKGSLKQNISSANSKKASTKSLNKGKGQEITGVSLPEKGKIKGWEFGQKKRIACANVNGGYYGIQGDCPRCGFDLWKGEILTDSDVWEDTPRVACPTCATTFSFKNGKPGPQIKRSGLAGFVGNLAKTATVDDSEATAKVFMIMKEEDRVFLREP